MHSGKQHSTEAPFKKRRLYTGQERTERSRPTMRLLANNKMSGTRPTAVAGLFYPDDPGELRRGVDGFLDHGFRGEDDPGVPPKAIVAPHAGYPYSGPIAGSAFASFQPLRGRIERIVVIGPSHHVPFEGLALPTADAFDSPLGRVELDLEACEQLLEHPEVHLDSRPHQREHAIEVELPFLQQVLGPFRLVPLIVGQASPEVVADVLGDVWGDERTRIVVSSDLSHFLDDAAARRTDQETAAQVLELAHDLTPHQACGARAWNGLNLLAQRQALKARLLDLRNSGDTAGGRDRVVGYGAFSYDSALPKESEPA